MARNASASCATAFRKRSDHRRKSDNSSHIHWQAGQEVEEEHRHHTKPLCVAPKKAGAELARIRVDTITGMAFSSLVSLAIVFATAATLHAHGITDIATSAQAAEALRPIAGEFAFVLVAAGIIGTGLLAVPVLAGSAAYAVSEMFGWAGSLEPDPKMHAPSMQR